MQYSRHLMAFLRMLISSALAFLCTAFSATADGHWSDIGDRLDGVQSWEELCAIEDCGQFPEGYATWAIGPDLFHFPLWDTLTERPVARYSLQVGRFYEQDQEGTIRRSFGYSSSLRFNDCCHYLLSFFSLNNGFPDIPTGRLQNRMPPARVHLSSHDIWPLGRHSVNRYLGLEASITAPPPRYSDVVPESLNSFNDDFWLLEFTRQNRYGFPSYTVLSKQPLVNDRYVVGYCGSTCGFVTVSFERDLDNTRPHISVRWVRLPGSSSFICNDEQTPSECNSAPRVFEQVPELLKRLELLFEAAQIYPE